MAITKADLLSPDPFSSARRTTRKRVQRARQRVVAISHPPPPPAASGIARPPSQQPAAQRATPVSSRTRRRAAPRTPAPTITRADLLSTDPFSSARRAGAQRLRQAANAMPDDRRLLNVPLLDHYTAPQRAAILAHQGRRIGAIMQHTGETAQQLLSRLNEHDRAQVRLFARLTREHQADIQREIVRRVVASGVPPSQVAAYLKASRRPARIPDKGDWPSPLEAGFATVLSPRNNLITAFAGGAGQLAAPLYRDSRDLIIHTPDSLYQLGRAGVGLAKYVGTSYPGAVGHDSADLQPTEDIAKGLTEGFVGNLARGRFGAAARYAGEHPLFAALEVSGLEGAIGRTAGAAMRSGALGSRAARAASMAREPLLDPYGRVLAHRRYSADVLRKGAVVALERYDRARGRSPNVSRPSMVPYRGLRQDSASAVDEYASAAEGVRRMGRDETMRRLHRALPDRGGNRVARARDRRLPASLGRIGTAQHGVDVASIVPRRLAGRLTRPEQDIVHAVVERRVDTRDFANTLRAERDRLDRAYARGTDRGHLNADGRVDYEPMSTNARVANRTQARAIARVLRDPRALANVRGVQQAADRYKIVADRVEQEAIRRGLIEPEQALASKVRPYAVARMGARYDHRLAAPEHMAHRYEQAQQLERAAGAKVARARDAERLSVRAVAAARRELATARAHAAAATARARLLADQAARAGRDPRRATLAALEHERARQLVAEHRLRAAVKGALDVRRARRAAEGELRAARKVREGANPRQYATGLVDATGRRLSTADVLAHMHANGVELPAFIGHRMDTAGAASFFVNWFGRRQTADGAGTRTGRATELGAHGSSFASLAEQAVRSRGIVDAARNFDGMVKGFGIKREDGQMFTWHEAERIREDHALIAARDSHGNPVPGYDELVPLRAVPARYSDATRRAVADMQDATHMPDFAGLLERRIAEAREAPPSAQAGARNVVLVPRAELERFAEHQTKGSGAATRAGQVVSNAFRRAVLPFSVKWLTGNTLEAALRLAIVGAGPNSWRIGRSVVRSLEAVDAEAAQMFRARTLGGLLYGGGDRLIVHRTAESFRDSPALGTIAGGAAVARRLPVVKQTLDGLGLYQRAVFRFNKAIEQNAQYAAIGKEAKQMLHETTGSWMQSVRAAGPAYDDLIQGLRGTPNQVRFARYLDETLGKYSRFSPGMRRFIQGYAPFLPWYLNSARFVLWTLPAKHPVKVALLTRVEQTFDADFRAQHANLPPGDLKAASVMRDGGLVNFARYMPQGAFTDLPRGLADPILPQFSSVIQAVQGHAFTGEQLRTSHGEVRDADKWMIALNAMAEAVVPGLSIARRIREKGSTPWDNSTIFSPQVKGGTRAKGGAARRILDPFRPIYVSGSAPAAPAKARGRGGAHGDGLDWSSATSTAAGEGLDWRNARVAGP